jgi:hypothetical protein
MADTPTPAPTAKKIVANPPKPIFTPWVFRATKLRAGMVDAVKSLVPAGNPEPNHLEIVKQLALDLIAELPDSANAVEVMIEANSTVNSNSGGGSIQTHVIVWPKTF